MLDFLNQIFSFVCGQSLAHTWAPGGEALPCCQRCTGVYAGAFVAALLHLASLPQSTRFWRGLNSGFLLLMIPAGFHWFPQNAAMRAASGVLFGFGVVAFLRLPFAGRISISNFRYPIADDGRSGGHKSQIAISALLLATLVGTPLLGESNNSSAASALASLTAGGALALVMLLAANVWLAARGLWRCFFQPPPRLDA